MEYVKEFFPKMKYLFPFYHFYYSKTCFFVPNFAKYPKKKPAFAGFFFGFIKVQ